MSSTDAINILNRLLCVGGIPVTGLTLPYLPTNEKYCHPSLSRCKYARVLDVYFLSILYSAMYPFNNAAVSDVTNTAQYIGFVVASAPKKGWIETSAGVLIPHIVVKNLVRLYAWVYLRFVSEYCSTRAT